jgi:hypothetical protein
MKGKRTDVWVGLYPKDHDRLRAVRNMLEESTGRPCSPGKVVIYLLDMHDDMRRIDEAVKKEAAKVNRLQKKGKKTK